MGIERYAAASNEGARELATTLTNEEVAALADELAKSGLRAWVHWQIEHESEVADFVAATPGQREKRLAWREPTLRRKLVLAAMIHCQAAFLLLSFLQNHERALLPGGSYRDTTALAGSLYWELMGTEVEYWPEDFEEICPSPFLLHE